jgi:hypothetical protein
MHFNNSSQIHIMRPNDSADQDVRELSSSEQEIYHKVCSLIDTAESKGKVLFVYRGERKSKLKKKLFLNLDEYSVRKFHDRLFYVGDKAKNFFETSKLKLENREYLKSINDISRGTFNFIFKQLHKFITTEPSEKDVKILKYLERLKQDQPAFIEFFSKESNSCKFVECLCDLDQAREQEMVRDYYLYFLHTRHSGGNSLFVSTSLDQCMAVNFALCREKSRKRRSIVLYYFVPQPFSKHGVNLSIAKEAQLICERIELPILKSELYPKQREFAVKGALFPHYIFGYSDLENDYDVVNPHLFKQPESCLENISEDGFLIDQIKFEKVITETGYSGFVTRWQSFEDHFFTDNYHR